MKIEQTRVARRARKPWVAPNLTRIGAGQAENGLNPVRNDGVFSMGS